MTLPIINEESRVYFKNEEFDKSYLIYLGRGCNILYLQTGSLYSNILTNQDMIINIEMKLRDRFDKIVDINHPSILKQVGSSNKDLQTGFYYIGFQCIIPEFADLDISEIDPPTIAITIFKIITGMALLHQHKIYGTDLSAYAIQFDEQNCVSFGIPLFLKPEKPSPYFAPEINSQLYKNDNQIFLETTEQSDIYSFGKLCCYLLTGIEPTSENLNLKNNNFNQRFIDLLMLEQCCNQDPKSRPSFEQILFNIYHQTNDFYPLRYAQMDYSIMSDENDIDSGEYQLNQEASSTIPVNEAIYKEIINAFCGSIKFYKLFDDFQNVFPEIKHNEVLQQFYNCNFVIRPFGQIDSNSELYTIYTIPLNFEKLSNLEFQDSKEIKKLSFASQIKIAIGVCKMFQIIQKSKSIFHPKCVINKSTGNPMILFKHSKHKSKSIATLIDQYRELIKFISPDSEPSDKLNFSNMNILFAYIMDELNNLPSKYSPFKTIFSAFAYGYKNFFSDQEKEFQGAIINYLEEIETNETKIKTLKTNDNDDDDWPLWMTIIETFQYRFYDIEIYQYSLFNQEKELKVYQQNSALHIALRTRNVPLALELIQNSKDVNRPDFYGYTPLHLAVLNNLYYLLPLLIQKGADLNAQTQYYLDTPLHLAVQKFSYESFNILTSNELDYSIKNIVDYTPLDLFLIHYPLIDNIENKNQNKMLNQLLFKTEFSFESSNVITNNMNLSNSSNNISNNNNNANDNNGNIPNKQKSSLTISPIVHFLNSYVYYMETLQTDSSQKIPKLEKEIQYVMSQILTSKFGKKMLESANFYYQMFHCSIMGDFIRYNYSSGLIDYLIKAGFDVNCEYNHILLLFKKHYLNLFLDFL